MPMYRYKCLWCGEEYRKILSERELFTKCPKDDCDGIGEIKDVPSNISTRYKGEGFYSTDYDDEGGDTE